MAEDLERATDYTKIVIKERNEALDEVRRLTEETKNLRDQITGQIKTIEDLTAQLDRETERAN